MRETVRNILRTEPTPIEINCKRKVPYPTPAMADKACEAMQQKEGAEFYSYHCELCGKYHIAHKESEKLRKEKALSEISLSYKFFHQHEGIYYAKIRDAFFNQYVFIVPDGIQEWENEVLDHGILVAYKKGHDLMREKDGVRSEHYKLFAPILPIIVKDQIEFSKKIEMHMENMCTLNEAINLFLNHSDSSSLTLAERVGRKIIVRTPPVPANDKELIEAHVKGREMHKGKEVFRDANNKPYFKYSEPCTKAGCTNRIEQRAYICTDKNGKLTWTKVRQAIDPDAKLVVGKQWICGECNRKASAAPAPPTEQRQRQGEEYRYDVLADLQNIVTDPNVDSDFVRGAALMACLLLKEKSPST